MKEIVFYAVGSLCVSFFFFFSFFFFKHATLVYMKERTDCNQKG